MPTSGGYFKSLALAREEEVQKEKRLEIMPEKKKAMSYRREGRVSFRGGRKGAFAPPWVLNAPPWILSAPHPFERTDIY